jgi:ribosomal protein L37AE/L43A
MDQAASRTCPRCGGNLLTNRHYEGVWHECLQCGWEREVELLSSQERSDRTLDTERPASQST